MLGSKPLYDILHCNGCMWIMQGPTHRLEIEPGFDGESTCLHVSDFEGDTTDIIVVSAAR